VLHFRPLVALVTFLLKRRYFQQDNLRNAWPSLPLKKNALCKGCRKDGFHFEWIKSLSQISLLNSLCSWRQKRHYHVDSYLIVSLLENFFRKSRIESYWNSFIKTLRKSRLLTHLSYMRLQCVVRTYLGSSRCSYISLSYELISQKVSTALVERISDLVVV